TADVFGSTHASHTGLTFSLRSQLGRHDQLAIGCGPLEYLRDSRDYAEVLFELAPRCDVMIEGEQSLPWGRKRLRVNEPDLMLVGLRAIGNTVEFLTASKYASVTNRDGRV